MTKPSLSLFQLKITAVGQLLAVLPALIFAFSCVDKSNSLASKLELQRIAAVDGAELDQISLSHGNFAYLQTIDLHKMELDQLTGNLDTRKSARGRYYPSEGKNSSPFFGRMTTEFVKENGVVAEVRENLL